jgi:hypothetical protein
MRYVPQLGKLYIAVSHLLNSGDMDSAWLRALGWVYQPMVSVKECCGRHCKGIGVTQVRKSFTCETNV